MPSCCRKRRRVFQNSSNVNSKRWIVPSIASSSGSGRATASPNRSSALPRLVMASRSVSSFIKQPPLALDALPEALRQVVHQDEVDQQQRGRLLVEVEVQLRPFAAVDP